MESWSRLERKSLYMNDLRRIGKTRIIRKMHAEVPAGWIASFSDLEGTHTAEEFAALVFKDSAAVLTGKQRTLRKMTDWLGKAKGMEVMGILKLPDGQPAPWKDVLRTTFDDIVEALKKLGAGHRMVFFWDEVPYLLDNIAAKQGKDTAAQVLDILRELSQRHDDIRLLLTGSIGIHHVLRNLWADGYKGAPLNHMDLIQPGPLLPEHAATFAAAEIARRGLMCAHPDHCAASLSESVSHVPFYIEKLVARWKGEVTAEVTAAEKLSDPHLEAIKGALKSITGEKSVDLNVKIDPAIIGGLVVKLGSRMVDSSLRTKLNAIKHAMKEAR